MAKKKYDLTITLQAAVSDGRYFTVSAGSETYKREQVSMTLDEAIAYRAQLSEQEDRTHSASIRMTYANDRKAPGLNNLRHLQKVGTDARSATGAAA